MWLYLHVPQERISKDKFSFPESDYHRLKPNPLLSSSSMPEWGASSFHSLSDQCYNRRLSKAFPASFPMATQSPPKQPGYTVHGAKSPTLLPRLVSVWGINEHLLQGHITPKSQATAGKTMQPTSQTLQDIEPETKGVHDAVLPSVLQPPWPAGVLKDQAMRSTALEIIYVMTPLLILYTDITIGGISDLATVICYYSTLLKTNHFTTVHF
jgi:hypothetical protein